MNAYYRMRWLWPSGVYLMSNGCGRVKIGMSADPEERRMNIELGAGIEIVILAVIPQSRERVYRIEARLHREFAELRELGEWFRDAPEILARFEALGAVTSAVLREGGVPRWLSD